MNIDIPYYICTDIILYENQHDIALIETCKANHAILSQLSEHQFVAKVFAYYIDL